MARTPKLVVERNLLKVPVLIEDTVSYSKYFEVSRLNPNFHAGKNGFLIRGTQFLKNGTIIQVEVLDRYGKTVFSNVIGNYSEGDARLVSVEITQKTRKGPGKLVVVGTATNYEDGRPIPLDQQNRPNVRWVFPIDIDPSRKNTSKLILQNTPAQILDGLSVTRTDFNTTSRTDAFVTSSTYTASLDYDFEGHRSDGYAITMLDSSGNPTPFFDDVSVDGYFTGSLYKREISNLYDTGVLVPDSQSIVLDYVTASVYTPLFKTLNETLAITEKSIKFGNGDDYLNPILRSGSYSRVVTSDDLGGNLVRKLEEEITSSVIFEYPTETLTTSANNSSILNFRIPYTQTHTGEIAKVRISAKEANPEITAYQLLTEFTPGERNILVTGSNTGNVSIGRFLTNDRLQNYWQSGLVNITDYENSQSANPITLVTSSAEILEGFYADHTESAVSYYFGTQKFYQLYQGVQYTLKYDAVYNPTYVSSSTTYSTTDTGSVKAYLTRIGSDAASKASSSVVIATKNGVTNTYGLLVDEVNTKNNDKGLYERQVNFTPERDGVAYLRFIVDSGFWNFSNFIITPAVEYGYNPDEIVVYAEDTILTGTTYIFRIEFIGWAGDISDEFISDPIELPPKGGGSSIRLISDRQVFSFGSDGTPTPTQQTASVDVVLTNITSTPQFTLVDDDAVDVDIQYYSASNGNLNIELYHTAFGAQTQSINPNPTSSILLTVSASAGGEIITDKFRFTRVKDAADGTPGKQGPSGSAGTDAKTVKLTLSDYSVVYSPAGTNPSPASITASAQQQNLVAPVTYSFFRTGSFATSASFAVVPTAPVTYSFVAPPVDDYDSQLIRVEVTESTTGIAFDTDDFFGVTPGKDGWTAILINEAHTIPAQSDGTPLNFGGSGADIEIIYGGTNLLPWTGSAPPDGYFSASIITSQSVNQPEKTGSIAELEGVQTYVRFGDIDFMEPTAKTGSITYEVSAYTSSYANTPRKFILKQSFSKTNDGTDGVDGGRRYYIEPQNGRSFKTDGNGVTVPTELIFITKLSEADTVTPIDSGSTFGLFFSSSGAPVPGAPSSANYSASAADITGHDVLQFKSGSTVLDTIDITDVTDGLDSLIPLLEVKGPIAWLSGSSGIDPDTPAQITASLYKTGSIAEYLYAKVDGFGRNEGMLPKYGLTGSVIVSSSNNVSGSFVDEYVSTGGDVFNLGFQFFATSSLFSGSGDYKQVAQETFVLTLDGKDGETGASGSNARTVRLNVSDYSIVYNEFGKDPSPSSIEATASVQNIVSESAYFAWFTGSTDVELQTVVAEGIGQFTQSFGMPNDVFNPKLIRVKVSESVDTDYVVEDSVNVYGVVPGENGFTIILTNDSHVIPTDFNGENEIYTGGGTDIEVLYGGTNLIPDTGSDGLVHAEFSASVIDQTNITVGTPATTSSLVYFRYPDPSNMTADNASITYAITASMSGSEYYFTKKQSFSKSKKGLSLPSTAVSLKYDDLQTTGNIAGLGRYALLTGSVETTGVNRDTKLKTQVTSILFYNIDADDEDRGYYLDTLGIGDTIQFWISDQRWYAYRITGVTGSFGTNSDAKKSSLYTVSFVSADTTDGTSDLSTAAGNDVYFRFSKAFPQSPSLPPIVYNADSFKGYANTPGTPTSPSITDTYLATWDTASNIHPSTNGLGYNTTQTSSRYDLVGYIGFGADISSSYQKFDTITYARDYIVNHAKTGSFVTLYYDSNNFGVYTYESLEASTTDVVIGVSHSYSTGRMTKYPAYSPSDSSQQKVQVFFSSPITASDGVTGASGSDAKVVKLTLSDYSVVYDKFGFDPSPTSITASATTQNLVGGNYEFNFYRTGSLLSTTGPGWSESTATASFVTPTQDNYTAQLIEVHVTESGDGVAFDTNQFYGVTPGTDGFSVILSNESHVFSAENNGDVISYTGGGTDIELLYGATNLSPDVTNDGLTHGEFSASVITSSSIDVGTFTAVSPYIRVGDPSNMTADNASITYAITASMSGSEYYFTKKQSFSKSKKGQTLFSNNASLFYDDLQIASTVSNPGQYALSTSNLDDGSGVSTHTALINNVAYIHWDIQDANSPARDNSALLDALEIGDHVTFWSSSARWYQYKITSLESAPRIDNRSVVVGVEYVSHDATDGTDDISTAAGTNVYFRFSKGFPTPPALPPIVYRSDSQTNFDTTPGTITSPTITNDHWALWDTTQTEFASLAATSSYFQDVNYIGFGASNSSSTTIFESPANTKEYITGHAKTGSYVTIYYDNNNFGVYTYESLEASSTDVVIGVSHSVSIGRLVNNGPYDGDNPVQINFSSPITASDGANGSDGADGADGAPGPGIVFRGVWDTNLDYIYDLTDGVLRRDAVLWSLDGNPPYIDYYMTSQSADSTIDAPHIETGSYWTYLGQQEFFVAAKIAIFEESYVQNTLNVGTNNGGSGSAANITLHGGTSNPYISIGQDDEPGGNQGYENGGIFVGMDSGVSKLSLSGSGGGMFWDGDTLTIDSAGLPDNSKLAGLWRFDYLQEDDTFKNFGYMLDSDGIVTTGDNLSSYITASGGYGGAYLRSTGSWGVGLVDGDAALIENPSHGVDGGYAVSASAQTWLVRFKLDGSQEVQSNDRIMTRDCTDGWCFRIASTGGQTPPWTTIDVTSEFDQNAGASSTNTTLTSDRWIVWGMVHDYTNDVGRLFIWDEIDGMIEDVTVSVSSDPADFPNGVLRAVKIAENSEANDRSTSNSSNRINGAWYDEVRFYTHAFTKQEFLKFAKESNSVGTGTRISGDQIQTGKIKSNNWSGPGSTVGSILDLNSGQLHLGGSGSNAALLWDGSTLNVDGAISASSGRFYGSVSVESDGKIYVGAGNYNNSDTPFYASSSFSLGDKLTWDGSILNVSGSISASNGYFSGSLYALGGNFKEYVNVGTNVAIGENAFDTLGTPPSKNPLAGVAATNQTEAISYSGQSNASVEFTGTVGSHISTDPTSRGDLIEVSVNIESITTSITNINTPPEPNAYFEIGQWWVNVYQDDSGTGTPTTFRQKIPLGIALYPAASGPSSSVSYGSVADTKVKFEIEYSVSYEFSWEWNSTTIFQYDITATSVTPKLSIDSGGIYGDVGDGPFNIVSTLLGGNTSITGSGASGGGITVSNNTNNYLLTATGGTSINGEANLTFDESTLALTGDLNVGSGDFFVDDSAGNVGIGTTSPDQTLHINKASGDAIIKIENSGDGNSSGIDFHRERFDGPDVVGGSIFIDSDTASNFATMYIQAQSANAGSGITTALTDNNGARIKIGGLDSDIVFETGASEVMRLMDAKVGIGTTDLVNQHPDTKLFVLGGITFEETTAASENNLPAITQWSTDGTAQDLVIGTRSATGKVLFYTGNSGTGGDWASSNNDQRMVIDSSGDVTIYNDLLTLGYVTSSRFISLSGSYVTDTGGDWNEVYNIWALDPSKDVTVSPTTGGTAGAAPNKTGFFYRGDVGINNRRYQWYHNNAEVMYIDGSGTAKLYVGGSEVLVAGGIVSNEQYFATKTGVARSDEHFSIQLSGFGGQEFGMRGSDPAFTSDGGLLTFSIPSHVSATTWQTSDVLYMTGSGGTNSTDVIEIDQQASSVTLRAKSGGTLNLEAASITQGGNAVVDTNGTGTNNEIATWSDSNTIVGEANLTFDGTTLSTNRISFTGQLYGDITANGTVASPWNLNWNNGNIQTFNNNGNKTVNVDNTGYNAGASYVLIITAVTGVTNGASWTWNLNGVTSSIKWVNGSKPEFSTTVGDVTVVQFFSDSATTAIGSWYQASAL